MTTKGAATGSNDPAAGIRFVGTVRTPPVDHGPIARLVLHGAAATADRRDLDASREMLVAALRALRERELHVAILVSPAGFVDHKPGGTWSGRTGWETTQDDFNRLAAVAASTASQLISPEVLDLARGTVGHFVLGIDVWPTERREPHAEVACLYDVATGIVRPVTGKSYPNTAQQDDLIRNPDTGTHVVRIAEERVAVLVCHDLAAWSPRGNAVAKGVRSVTWQGMQASVEAERPTLAVQLPHTVDTAGTWRAAWSRFAERSGGRLTSGTTAIRHLDRRYRPVLGSIDPKLLAQTGWGKRVVDVVVADERDVS